MLKLIRLSSVSKEFFDLLDKSKRQKKAVSISKLIVVSVICFLVIGFYAMRVNQASTRGYFLKQETKKYDELVFQRSIVQLDNLQLERELYDRVFKWRESRYDKNEKRVVVTIGKPQDEVQQEAVVGDIVLPEIVASEDGMVTIFEYEE
jgi:hypothetical protein